MKQILIFKTGETTCSEKPAYPGSMCPFMDYPLKGYFCFLYEEYLIEKDEDGYTKRLPKCISENKGIKELE